MWPVEETGHFDIGQGEFLFVLKLIIFPIDHMVSWLSIVLQALDGSALQKEEPLKLVFLVPKTKYPTFGSQKITLGTGADGVSPVKSGPQLKVEGRVAQFAMAVDFVPTI